MGEFCDYIDKYFKYKIGKDQVMELQFLRDILQRKFQILKVKFYIEQFFPFPDGIVYLDVLEKNSLKRKIKDNHTLAEMRSKRKNYLNLIKEFDEIEKYHSKNF